MYLIYCDESGNTGANLNDAQQPYHLMMAVLVHEQQWQAVDTSFRTVKEAALNTMGLPIHTEIHCCDLFRENNAFHGVSFSERIALIQSILQLVTDQGIALIWCAVRKIGLTRYINPMHPHDLAFLLVAERCQAFLSNRGERAVFIADESPGCELMLKTSLRQYQANGVPFGRRTGPMDCLLDTIHFVDSAESAFIQTADVCAYFSRRNIQNNTDPQYRVIANSVVDHYVFT